MIYSTGRLGFNFNVERGLCVWFGVSFLIAVCRRHHFGLMVLVVVEDEEEDVGCFNSVLCVVCCVLCCVVLCCVVLFCVVLS